MILKGAKPRRLADRATWSIVSEVLGCVGDYQSGPARDQFDALSALVIYTKGERVLRIEAVAHNTQELNCGRSLEKSPEVVLRLKSMLERFADALSCIDQCFIADDMLEHLPAASRVGKTIVGGIDFNKTRMRQVVEALIALSPSPNGFTA